MAHTRHPLKQNIPSVCEARKNPNTKYLEQMSVLFCVYISSECNQNLIDFLPNERIRTQRSRTQYVAEVSTDKKNERKKRWNKQLAISERRNVLARFLMCFRSFKLLGLWQNNINESVCIVMRFDFAHLIRGTVLMVFVDLSANEYIYHFRSFVRSSYAVSVCELIQCGI